MTIKHTSTGSHKQISHPIRLTSIRGIASVVVLMHHAMLLFRVDGRNDTLHLAFQFGEPWLLMQQVLLIIFNGQAAVTLFFVLSGCVLSLSLQRTPISGLIIIGFYIKRMFRILPTLWLAVIVSLILLPGNSHLHLNEVSTRWMQTAYSRNPTLYDIARHLIGVDSFLDQPLWSLFVELFYSAIFPLIFLLTGSKPRSIAIISFSLALIFAPFNMSRDLNYYLLAFVLGSVIANVASAPRTMRPTVSMVLFAIATIVLLGARRFIDPIGGPLSVIVTVETTAAAGIIYLVMFVDRGTNWLNCGPLIHLGNISFSLYLLHFPILFVIARCLQKIVGDDFIVLHGILSNLITAIFTFLVVVPIATLTFEWLEVPAQRLGRKLAGKVSAAAGG